MSFTTINAPDAPKALGSYSHGIKSGSMILTSGQIALDPKTGVLEKETCASTRQVLANLPAIVRAGGGDLESIARVDIALTDAVDLSVFNDEYAHFFGTHKPARFTYFVKALPAGATMELSVAAFI